MRAEPNLNYVEEASPEKDAVAQPGPCQPHRKTQVQGASHLVASTTRAPWNRNLETSHRATSSWSFRCIHRRSFATILHPEKDRLLVEKVLVYPLRAQYQPAESPSEKVSQRLVPHSPANLRGVHAE